MASIQQYIDRERLKALGLRTLLAGGVGAARGPAARPERGRDAPLSTKGCPGGRARAVGGAAANSDGAREAHGDPKGGADGQGSDGADGVDDLQELIDDAERALVGDLGSDRDEIDERWRAMAAGHRAGESDPRPPRREWALRRLGQLWDKAESAAAPSRLDGYGAERGGGYRPEKRRYVLGALGQIWSNLESEGKHRSRLEDRPEEFGEEDWRRLGDSVLRPQSGAEHGGAQQGRWMGADECGSAALATAEPGPRGGPRCCLCGAARLAKQDPMGCARCMACVATGAHCRGCAGRPTPFGFPSPCGGGQHGGGCDGDGCGDGCDCDCGGGREGGNNGAAARGCGRGRRALGSARPPRRRDSKGRWLPHGHSVDFHEAGSHAAGPHAVDSSARHALEALEARSTAIEDFCSNSEDGRPVSRLLMLILIALGLVAGAALPQR